MRYKNILDRRMKVYNLILNIRECLEINLDNEEYKKEFINFIENLKNIKPLTNEEYIKYNKFNEDYSTCLFVDTKMVHLKALMKIKKYILKDNWYKVLDSLIKLDRSYDLLEKKVYYSLIEILND